MPFSYSSQLSTIVGYVEQQNPATILDVGIGMGQYGFLLRTNLKILIFLKLTVLTRDSKTNERGES